MIALIFISVYVISVALVYLWVRLAYYHKNGICNEMGVNKVWLFLTFCPIINIAAVFISWIGHYPLKKNNDIHTNFFKPRK